MHLAGYAGMGLHAQKDQDLYTFLFTLHAQSIIPFLSIVLTLFWSFSGAEIQLICCSFISGLVFYY